MIIRRSNRAARDDGAEQYSFRVSLSSADIKAWLRRSYESHCYIGTDGKYRKTANWIDLYDTAKFLKSEIESAISWLPSYKREPVIEWAYQLAVSKGYIVEVDNGIAFVDYEKVCVRPGPQTSKEY